MKKALVLLSGGIDSAVALWWARDKGWTLSTFTFLFPGRRRNELRATRALRRLAGSRENHELWLPFVPRPRTDQACYIPLRNLMYYGTAASLAETTGAGVIVGGHIRHDGEVFPDARKSYLSRIEALARAGSKRRSDIKLVFPFITKTKKVIIETGLKLGVPFDRAWSCSNDGKSHCWKCNSCKERISGFREAGVKDPLYHE